MERTTQIWTLKDGRKIQLIHETELKEIKDGTVLTDIFGESHIKGEDEIDLDTRGGYLAYGILKEN